MTYTDELTGGDPQHEAKYYLRTAVNADGKIIAHHSRAYLNGGATGRAARMRRMQRAAEASRWASTTSPTPCSSRTWSTRTSCRRGTCAPRARSTAPRPARSTSITSPASSGWTRRVPPAQLPARRRHDAQRRPCGPTRAAEVLETLRRETNWAAAEGDGRQAATGSSASTPNPQTPLRGRGIALRDRHVGAGKTEILFRLQQDGTIEALSGTPDQGGGSHTVLQRVAAATLSVEPTRVHVRYGNTAEALLDAGSGGSRTTTMVGRAALDGCRILKDTLEDLAAEVMGWPAGQVRIDHDEFVVDGSAERAPFAEVARRIATGPSVQAIGTFDPADPHPEDTGDANFYAYMAEVEVDPETGRVTPIEVVCVVDVGTIINPVAHQGQMDGGFIYGLGQALTEELPHEEGVITTQSLGEYKLPVQMDTPRFRTVLLERDPGPGAYGAKAAGEVTNTAVGGAIANAIYDATGVLIMTSPITSERVLAALRAAGTTPS